MDSIKEHLQNLYPDCWEELEQRIEALTESWKLRWGVPPVRRFIHG